MDTEPPTYKKEMKLRRGVGPAAGYASHNRRLWAHPGTYALGGRAARPAGSGSDVLSIFIISSLPGGFFRGYYRAACQGRRSPDLRNPRENDFPTIGSPLSLGGGVGADESPRRVELWRS